MVNVENVSTNELIASDIIDEELHIYEDELDIIDYFLVIWKHRRLILVCSVLPTLIAGFSIYLSPKSYVITYTYDVRDDARVAMMDDAEDSKSYTVRGDISRWNLNEKNFHVLQSRFYSEDNLDKIASELQKDGLDEQANQVRKGVGNGSKRFVEFEALPPFVNLSNLKVTDPGHFEKLRDMKAFLLYMTITGKPLEDIGEIALTIRDNFEEVSPLYMIQEQLSTEIRGYNSKQASIECSRFGLELELRKNNGILAELKKIDVTALDEKRGEVVLQFNVGEQSQYLPLSYQIQAVESKIVELQGQINADTANHKYYEDLLGLSAQMITELNDKLSSDQIYTIELFKSFLENLTGKIEKQELTDYLASYVKKVENRISVTKPVMENPKMHLVAKGTVKKSVSVFAVALIISVFASFILEGFKKRQVEMS